MRDRSIDRLFRRYCDTRDPRALAEIFDRVAPDLARIAAHFSRSEDEVEDAVQTAFLTAIEHPESADPDRPFFPWMIGVVVNRCRELARKRRRTPEPDRLHSRESTDPATRATELEFQRAVDRSVEALSKSYRSTVKAYLLEGLTASEIAEREGITANAARVRLHRGLRALRKILPTGFALGAVAVLRGPALARVRQHLISRMTSSSLPATALPVATSKSMGLGAIFAACGLLVAAAFILQALLKDRRASSAEVDQVAQFETASPEDGDALSALTEGSSSSSRRAIAGGSAEGEPAKSPFTLTVKDRETGEPIVGATVRRAARDEVAVLARTNEEGIAKFAALTEVEHELRVDAPGYASWRRPRHITNTAAMLGAHGINAETVPVAVSFRIELRAGGSKSGIVVDDATGSPIEGATIYLFETSRFQPVAISNRPVGLSDHEGRFSIDGGVPFRNEAGDDMMFLAVHAANVERTGTVRFAMLREADLAPVTIRCRPSARALITVRDENGQPLSGIEVVARPRSGPWALSEVSSKSLRGMRTRFPASFIESFHATTNSAGLASFERLVRVSENSGWGASAKDLSGGYGFEIVAAHWKGGIEEVHFEGHEVQRHEITAETKRFVRIAGVCRAKDGSEIAGARVARSKSGDPEQLTDAEGRFDLGEFPVEAFPLTVLSVPENHLARRVPVDLPNGNDNEVFLTIEHETAIGLHGRVVDELGNGVSDAELLIRGSGSPLLSGRTSEDGSFEFGNVGRGERELSVLAEDGRTRFLRVEAGELPISVELPSLDSELELRLRLVADSEEAPRPIPGLIRFTDEEGRSFERGHHAILSVSSGPRRMLREPGLVRAVGVPPGRWMVRVECDGYAPAVMTIDVHPGAGAMERRVMLERPGSLRGQCLGALGDERVSVSFTRTLSKEREELPLHIWNLETVEFDCTAGEFLAELAPGSWWATARQKDFLACMRIEVHAGENAPVELRLKEGAQLVLPNSPGRKGALLELRVGTESARQVLVGEPREEGTTWRVPPGELEWRIFGASDLSSDDPAEWTRGRAALEPGETRVLDL